MAGTALVAALGATLFGCKTLEIEAKTGDIANCFIKPANPMEMKCWTNNEEPHFIWSGPVKLHLINDLSYSTINCAT